ncbi:fumarylacetoacetate hydrolase family protein [Sphingobium sp. BS19]|uniref:fumarylacetoacetate hydrolase family protein n=1 Tax=Sphingobium sp. BS19 TaxID=3018973 RepID=UPI0022EF0D5B|nr:fumarylacetoacetate hydrolase family protein [Sphingobium sp. BS19]GLJ00453.1 5-oxopent-3-ene-1,2,5-tricarboxylate decarboxylase [Sphingobium sp. BS19]
MRLLSFERNGATTLGLRLGEEVVDLGREMPQFSGDMAAFLAAGPDALEAARLIGERATERLPFETVKCCVPVPRCDKNIGLGLNYLRHIREMDPNFQVPEFPGMFMRVPSSTVAHLEPIVRPSISDTLDYEGELMVVIGKAGRHIPIERAFDHVAGYTCHNDGSVREFNRLPMSITAGKNFDRTGAIGPEIVTADELPLGCKGLRLRTRVNGELRQDEDLAEMHWDVATLIHLMSRMMVLLPGDLLTTGTPPGVGAGFNPPKFLKAGDTVEVEIEGLATLINPIVDERVTT